MSEKHVKSTQPSASTSPETEPAAAEAEAAAEVAVEDSEATPAEQAPASEPAAKRRDPIRLVTVVVLLFALLLFSWRIVASRFTPYTDQARVRALIVPLTPRVSGFVTEVNVRLHSIVEEGDVLFQLDRRPYEAAVEAAEAALDNSTQVVGARSAGVKAAAAQVGVARAQLDRAQRNWNRTEAILEESPGALSQADVDRTETSLTQSIEKVTSAEANLERSQEELGIEGPENPQIRAAVAALEQAQLDLAFTQIIAPSHGIIESFNLDVGHYAAANQPLATFVSTHDAWIQADMTENNISIMKAGDPVELALDVAPGQVFKGVVRSIGYGVNAGSPVVRGELPTVSTSSGWLREPQRFPVIVGIESEVALTRLRSGGQVDVTVYTSENELLNTVARWYIRMQAFFSYVR